MLFAREGSEDVAIRGLRRGDARGSKDDSWDIFYIPAKSLKSTSWMPKPLAQMLALRSIAASDHPRVQDLFSVKQGIRTGNNKVFVLDENAYDSLPPNERQFFRPAAGTATIRDCRLVSTEFVFYPYGDAGPTLQDESDVRRLVPQYYSKYLEPNKERLSKRAKTNPDQWWLLQWHRTWLVTPAPKLVSCYFGDRGSFAYDAEGAYAVVQGYAWLWRRKLGRNAPSFAESHLPWAYLAILNSRAFESLLEAFSPRVQGGQFNLSTRFVNAIPLPDLSNDLRVTAKVLDELAEIGRAMTRGAEYSGEVLETCVKRSYGLTATK
jgi:hypothetical protein